MIVDPVNVGGRSAGDHVVEARRLSFGHFEVGRKHADLRPEVGLRDSAKLAIHPQVTTTTTDRQTDKK